MKHKKEDNTKWKVCINWNDCINITYVKQEYIEGFGWKTICSKNFKFFEKKNKTR